MFSLFSCSPRIAVLLLEGGAKSSDDFNVDAEATVLNIHTCGKTTFYKRGFSTKIHIFQNTLQFARNLLHMCNIHISEERQRKYMQRQRKYVENTKEICTEDKGNMYKSQGNVYKSQRICTKEKGKGTFPGKAQQYLTSLF
jgi:hypothetical protein